jgi:hypothetical protein
MRTICASEGCLGSIPVDLTLLQCRLESFADIMAERLVEFPVDARRQRQRGKAEYEDETHAALVHRLLARVTGDCVCTEAEQTMGALAHVGSECYQGFHLI